MTKIGITGCTGRMGKELLAAILSHPHCDLAGATARAENIYVGKDVAALLHSDPMGITISSDVEALFHESDAIIDFSQPEHSLQCAELAARLHVPHIIGTTGFTDLQKQQLTLFAKNTPIIWSANMSIGVNLLFSLVEQAARLLDAHYDIEIVEMHHHHKVDAPSGTALSLGEAAAAGRGVSLQEQGVYSRHGHTGARAKGSIGFATLRGGDVIGDHTVIFAGEGERIELTHKSSSRKIYANGAVRAALWAQGKQPGLYSMKDVLSS